MAFDYESAKAEFGVGRAREMEKEYKGSISAATDAPQATSQPQVSEAPAKKAGVGQGGWNEDFDEAWGRRVLENPKLKEQFGLSGYESLRDEGTRREINKWLRKQQAGGGEAAAPAAAPAKPAAAAASASTTGAGTKAGPNQPAGTTGKASIISKEAGLKPAPRPEPGRGVLPSGRLPVGQLFPATTLPASGGTIPAQNGPWWPSYPVGAGAPPATSPGVASMQAAALEQQGGR